MGKGRESSKGFLVEAIEGNCIPVEYFKELPRKLRMPMTVIAQCIIIGTFVYFTYSSYKSESTNHFISLDSNAGKCAQVSKSLSGTFLVSDSGHWEGSINFKYSESLIGFTIRNLYETQSHWAIDFGYVGSLLQSELQSLLATQNFAWNLIVLMEAINFYEIGGYNQYVFFTATPSAVFSTERSLATVGNRNQICPVDLFVDYYSISAQVVLTVDYAAMASQCSAAVDPLLYYPLGGRSTSQTIIDMNTVTTALAVNMGYLDVNLLEELTLPSAIEEYNTFYFPNLLKTYKIKQLVNKRHPGMSPVYCFFAEPFGPEDLLACLVRTGSTFYVPIINHVGGFVAQTFGIPEFCDCKNDVGHSAYCDQMDIMPALIFDGTYHGFGYEDVARGLQPLITMLVDYQLMVPDGTRAFYYLLTLQAYPASLLLLNQTKTFYNGGPQIPDGYHAANVFKFCGNCSMYSFRFTDPAKTVVSPFGYSVFDGSCAPIIDLENWNLVESTAPQSLVEIYYTCTENWYTAFYNALGISMGIGSLIIAAIAVLFLPVYCIHQAKRANVIHVCRPVEGDAAGDVELGSEKFPADNDNEKALPHTKHNNFNWAEFSSHVTSIRSAIQRGEVAFDQNNIQHQLAMCLPSTEPFVKEISTNVVAFDGESQRDGDC